MLQRAVYFVAYEILFFLLFFYWNFDNDNDYNYDNDTATKSKDINEYSANIKTCV